MKPKDQRIAIATSVGWETGRLVSKMDRVRATAKQLAKAYLTTIGRLSE